MATRQPQSSPPTSGRVGTFFAETAGRGEAYIPVRKSQLVDALGARLEPDVERALWRRFAALVDRLVHVRYQNTLERLKSAYAPFDPDVETHPGRELPPLELDTLRQALFHDFARLLERGNFDRIAEEAIDQALDDCSHSGLNLHVNLDMFQHLEIYGRGQVQGTRYRRRLFNAFRPEAFQLPIYQRLAVIFRLRAAGPMSKALDTEAVYIKLFKDIPKMDLDMLLPGTRVRMSMLDRAKIMLPTLSGLAIVIWKLVFSALAIAAAGSLALWGLVGGTVGYGARSFFGYLNTRQKYQLNLTQSLYFQNLDNNAGVIHRLVDEAEEQENREVLLAWWHLWRDAPAGGWTAAELDAAIEHSVQAHTGRRIDFEISDALAKLAELEIASELEGRWTALAIDEALDRLSRLWTRIGSEP